MALLRARGDGGGRALALPVASALARRDRLWPAVAASVVAHAALVGWGVARQPAPPLDLAQKPIAARLVRLGEKRPEEWLPRKEAPPPPPATAPAPPPKVTAPPVSAVAKPAAPSAAAKAPAPAPAAAPAVGAPPRPGAASLASILSKVQRDVDERRYGDPEGSAAGDADTAEGDQYAALVDRALRANYVVPVTVPERERMHLEAGVILWIEPDGRITRWKQDRSSGNPTFDSAVERTLRATARVPPPPEHLRDSYRRVGIQLLFRAI
jgi:colicin import membrane protein/protein TonB